jgi:hypothetical protein
MQFPSNGLPELREVTFSGNIGVRIALLIIHSSKIPINWMDRFLYVVVRPRNQLRGLFYILPPRIDPSGNSLRYNHLLNKFDFGLIKV